MGKPVALRTSLIWHDEVMGDVVSERPQKITIGPASDATFTTPNIGLPDRFAIVRPGSRGYMLALGNEMRGTVCIGGVEHDVAKLVRDSDSGFHASSIGGLDWGVIELDASGAYKLFFQFVPLEEAVPVLPRPVLIAGGMGYAISAAVLSLMWGLNGFSIDEAIFRGVGLATLALGVAALVRWVFRQDGESRASLAFSMILHAAILFATFRIYAHQDPYVYPGPRDLTASYLVTRIEATPQVQMVATPKPAAALPAQKGIDTPLPEAPPFHEPPPPKKAQPAVQQQPKIGKPNNGKPSKGDPDKKPGAQEPSIADPFKQIAIGDNGGQDELADALGGDGDGSAGDAAAKIAGKTTKGGGGKGKTAGHFKKGDPNAKLETGPMRKPSMCYGSSCGGGETEVTPTDNNRDKDGTSLTATDIDRVIKAAQGTLTTCYQRELNRDPTLAGMVQVRFVIGADGRVESAKVTDNGVRNEDVGDCVAQRIRWLKFPAKGRAVVKYPFAFQSH